MQIKSIQQLLQERSELFIEIAKLTLLLHGSWIERYSTCSREQCKCHHGQRHGPHYCLVVNQDGHQRQKYIAQTQVGTAQKGLAQYKRLQELVDQITRINLSIMKEEAKRESR
jgi:hypothetical protein